MSLFGRAVARALPVLPRALVGKVASRYVAGERLDDALAAMRALAAEGAMATVDILGEEVSEAARATAAVEAYEEVLDAIEREGLPANVSVKLTAIGLKIDEALCRENLARLAERARSHGNFVRIDMEDHTCTDATLRLYRELQPRLGNLGIVLQARLRRTPADIEALAPMRPNVRLCKGIYLEPEAIALTDAGAIREAFVAQLHQLIEAGCYVAIATHDDALVDAGRQAVARHRLERDQYEFQMLLGVRPRLRRQLLREGHRLRVYVPFGSDWYAYSLRRLRENPDVAKHIARAIFYAG